MKRIATLAAILGLMLAGGAFPLALAQAPEEEAPEFKKWTNSTELGIVITQGNSNTQNIAFKDTLRRFWEEKARFQLKLQATLLQSSDDRFREVDPGFTWEPGAPPPTDFTTSLVEPGLDSDNEIYLAEGRYDRTIRKNFTWNAGASWDRNLDAGIINRYIAFGGVGNIWWDRDDLQFNTSYGLSFTRRDETTPDPLKDEKFPGIRFTWDYLNMWGKVTTYENDWTINMNLKDPGDFWFDMVNAISVKINKWLALSVSLQWLYNNEPALEDIDVVAQVEIVDPDGIPGNGDEFFITTDSGAVIELGEVKERKKPLDQIFNTSLVIRF